MKPMTQGQIDPHEIAMSAEATESHLNGIRVLIVALKRKGLRKLSVFLLGMIAGEWLVYTLVK